MLTIPQEIKDLLHQDHCQKNIRIHFPNGERTDICNDLIVKDSVQFTESICSRDSLKFGLCESPVFECETVGVGNIKGATIEVYCEIYCDPSVSDAVFKTDLQAYIYPIPYGLFTVDSCQRQADMNHRRIVAYGYMQLDDLKQNMDLLPIFNGGWYSNENLIIKRQLLELLMSEVNGSAASLPTRSGGLAPSQDYDITFEGIMLEKFATDSPVEYTNPPESVTGAHYYFRKYRIVVNKSFNLDNYLTSLKIFHDEVMQIASGADPATKNRLSWYCKPHIYIVPDTYTFAHYGVSGGSLTYDYWTGDDSSPFEDESEIAASTFGKTFLTYELDKLVQKTSSVCEYCWTYGELVIYLPKKIVFGWQTGGSRKTKKWEFDTTNAFTIKELSADYDASNNTDKFAILIPRTLSASVSRNKYIYNGSASAITRTEYYSDGESADINLMDFFRDSYELEGVFGKKTRAGGFESVDIQRQFGLRPNSTLYPGQTLYPEGVTGGSIVPEDYQSCWYNDEYTKLFGAVQCIYTNNNNEKVLHIMHFNGFTEYDDPDLFLTYDISDNYVVRNNTFTENEIVSILETLSGQLEKITYMPVDFTGRGLPYVEAGDTFEILTRSNDSITTIVLNRTLSGDQTLTDNYKSV